MDGAFFLKFKCFVNTAQVNRKDFVTPVLFFSFFLSRRLNFLLSFFLTAEFWLLWNLVEEFRTQPSELHTTHIRSKSVCKWARGRAVVEWHQDVFVVRWLLLGILGPQVCWGLLISTAVVEQEVTSRCVTLWRDVNEWSHSLEDEDNDNWGWGEEEIQRLRQQTFTMVDGELGLARLLHRKVHQTLVRLYLTHEGTSWVPPCAVGRIRWNIDVLTSWCSR